MITRTFEGIQILNVSIYLLTPWSRVLLEKLTGLRLVKKFPTFYGIRWFITAFTSAHYLSLSRVSSIHSIHPHPTYWISILILYSHLRLGLPSSLFPSGIPTNALYTPVLSPIRAACPAHLILLDFITRTFLGEEYRSLISSCSFLHSLVTWSPLGSNILLNTLFSNNLCLPTFVSQCQRPNLIPIQNNRQNYSSVYFNLYIFRYQTGRAEILHRTKASIPWLQSALYFFQNRIWFVKLVPKYLNSSILSNELLSVLILWLRPAFWSGDMTMYLVLSAFTYL